MFAQAGALATAIGAEMWGGVLTADGLVRTPATRPSAQKQAGSIPRIRTERRPCDLPGRRSGLTRLMGSARDGPWADPLFPRGKGAVWISVSVSMTAS